MIDFYRARSISLVALAAMSLGGTAMAQMSRADAMRAADAAAGLPEAPLDPSIPTCAAPPPSGTKLAGDMELSGEGHSVEFQNGGGGEAIVKMRHAGTGKLAASFLLRKLETLSIDGVPDGEYVIQYAFGPALAPDCKSFTRIIRANQLPETDALKTAVIDDEDHTEVKRMSVAYQLSVTESGNMKPVSINAAAFNAD